MQLHYELNDFMNIDIMALLPIVLPVIVLGTLLILIALVDLYRHRKIRKNVFIWTLIVLLVNTFGPILYFILGRKDSDKS